MLKLIIVDDEKIIRDGLAKMIPFSELNLELSALCKNSFEALDSMLDDMPDIMITDIKMAKMDGLMLIDRALQLNPNLKCIVLSGYNDFYFAQKAIKMGVSDYLLKPCTSEDITNALRKSCNEILQFHRQTVYALEDRNKQIAELAEQILTFFRIYKDKELEQHIRVLVDLTDDIELLRSAYIYLIAKNERQPERGFLEIQNTYECHEEWYRIFLEKIPLLMHDDEHPRGFVRQMCRYVQDHYDDSNLSLQYLADHVIYLRADYIGREFSKQMNMKFSEYLLSFRMKKAKILLCEPGGDQRIYEVAEALGLGHNPKYFSQLFKKYTGLTPSEYLKRCQNNNNI